MPRWSAGGRAPCLNGRTTPRRHSVPRHATGAATFRTSAYRRSAPSSSRGPKRKRTWRAARSSGLSRAGGALALLRRDPPIANDDRAKCGETFFRNRGTCDMSKTATITLSVDPKLLQSASRLLGRVGVNTSDAMTLFLQQVVRQGGLPVDMG